MTGASSIGSEPVPLAGERAEQRGPGVGVAAQRLVAAPAPSPGRARGRRTVPASSAWATGASGWTHSRPWRARSSERKNGDARLSGWTDEHDVVDEARAASARPSATRRRRSSRGLVDPDRPARPRELDRGGEPVRAAARRRSRRAPSLRRHGVVAPSRTAPAARVSPPPPDPAGRCRDRADGHVDGRAVAHVARVLPLAALVDADLAGSRRPGPRRPATGRGSRASAPRTGRWPGSRRTCSDSSMNGSLVRSSAWTWTTVSSSSR